MISKHRLIEQCGAVEVNLAGLLLLIGAAMTTPGDMNLEDIMEMLDTDDGTPDGAL